MRIFLAVTFVILTAACGLVPTGPTPQERLQAAIDLAFREAEARRLPLSWTIAKINERRLDILGPNRYQDEFFAYLAVVVDDLTAGKISENQASYLITQKKNQLDRQAESDSALRVARDAQNLNALGVYLQMMQPPPPRQLPPPRAPITCDTYAYGRNSTTTCQ